MKTHCNSVVVLGALVLFIAVPVRAQVGWVEIETNQTDAFVYADSTWLGIAERSLFQIPRGADRIILVPRAADVWSVPAISHLLRGSGLDTIKVKLNFPYFYRLETVPSGVDIYLTDGTVRRYLGTSPLDYRSDTPLLGELVFDQAGYVTRRVEPGSDIWNRHLVLLESVEQMDPLLSAGVRRTTGHTKWIDYVAVGTAVVGGLLAVHYKTKADRLYDEYTETRDRALKPDVEQFDLYSGIALGAMQVGLGVLAFRLIF
ncbi:MAG: hypothetical protein BMS9Abin05_1937 [Rhodothermia bacterium]|nr:MAG: hypothetical protein BMS9Abin05_1937 [Rhodothermia bacterium]